MASQVRRYELSALGFDIAAQVPAGAVTAVSQRSTLITIDVTIEDTVPNAAADTDECMAVHGWEFLTIV